MLHRPARALRWAFALLPAVLRIDARERWRAAAGAGLGLLATALVARWLAGTTGLTPWLVAPLGATTVLVFALPSSPLAQPWPVIGGSTVSAVIGLACAGAIPDEALAGSIAVAAAIGAMLLLRCLHPPGGAVALLAVLAHAPGGRMFPLAVLANTAAMVLVGAVYNTLTGRRYPHRQVAAPAPSGASASRFSAADLDVALAHYNQVLDVSRDDLEALLHHAETAAYRRTLGELRCRDVMSPDPIAVTRDTPLEGAWALMRERRIKALPVVDGQRHVVGILTQGDFVRERLAGPADARTIADPASPPGGTPATVGRIMTRRVRVASASLHLIELLPLFSEGGHHHLPVLGDDGTLAGVITQSDVVRALHRAVRPD